MEPRTEIGTDDPAEKQLWEEFGGYLHLLSQSFGAPMRQTLEEAERRLSLNAEDQMRLMLKEHQDMVATLHQEQDTLRTMMKDLQASIDSVRKGLSLFPRIDFKVKLLMTMGIIGMIMLGLILLNRQLL